VGVCRGQSRAPQATHPTIWDITRTGVARGAPNHPIITTGRTVRDDQGRTAVRPSGLMRGVRPYATTIRT